MKITTFECLQDKQKRLESFDPHRQTWVVSDLSSKFEIQKHLLEKNGLLEEDAVLRASELWGKLFYQSEFETRVVSLDLMKNIIFDWLKSKNLPWVRSTESSQNFLDYFNQLLPIINLQENLYLLTDWLKENPDSLMRWGHWVELCFEFWQYLKDKKIILSSWIPALLLSAEKCKWNRDIIFDVGVDLTGVESDLLSRMYFQQGEIELLKPSGEWCKKYFQQMWPYEIFNLDSFNLNDLSGAGSLVLKEEAIEKIQLHHFATTVSEIKFLCSEIRALLDQGVLAQEIGVFHANIENVWPVIRHYLEEEGIAFSKSVLVRAQTLPDVDLWLSKLRLSIKNVQSVDLENVLYSGEILTDVSLDRYYQIFSQIYDFQDLKREKDIYDFVKNELLREHKPENVLSRDAFVVWALSHWSKNAELDVLHKVWSSFFTETPINLKLKLSTWLNFLEGITANVEIPLEDDKKSTGILLGNLSSCPWLNFKYWFCIGAEENSLRSSNKTGLSFTEVLRLSMDLGLHLSFPDQMQNEFNLRSIFEKNYEKLHLSYSSSSFQGDVQAPSRLFLMLSLKLYDRSIEPESAAPSRWDEIQKMDLKEVESIRPQVDSKLWLESFQEDSGQKNIDLCPLPNGLNLSASLLESYCNCPFKFAAERLFQLVDGPSLDFDVDHMTKGSFVHALYENLLVEPFKVGWTDKEIYELLDKCRDQVSLQMIDNSFWEPFREYYFILSRKFLNFEKNWREQFPQTQTIAKELFLNAYWDQEQCEFVSIKEPKKKSYIEFKGFIDRVDRDESNNIIVIDYKSSDAQISNYKKWVENSKFQMALYGMIIDSGLTEENLGTVVGANYYNVKTQKRKSGFLVKEKCLTLAEKPNTYNGLEEDQKLELYQSTLTKITQVIESISKGSIPPKPLKYEDCTSCSWSNLCRAPHLH